MLWFRERAAEATGRLGVATPIAAGAVELPVFGPVANGLDASRRRREALRRSRTTRRTRTAALVLGPAIVLSVAAPKLAGGRAGTPLAEDPPSLTLRLRTRVEPRRGGGTTAAARSRCCGSTGPRCARTPERARRRSTIHWRPRDRPRPALRRQPGRRHAAPDRGPGLGHVEPEHRQRAEPPRTGSSVTERTIRTAPLGRRRLPRPASRRAARRDRRHQPAARRHHRSARLAPERPRRRRVLPAPDGAAGARPRPGRSTMRSHRTSSTASSPPARR